MIIYADDHLILFKTHEETITWIPIISRHLERYGLMINKKKSKFMIVTSRPQRIQNIRNGQNLYPSEFFRIFKYLGTEIGMVMEEVYREIIDKYLDKPLEKKFDWLK